MQEKSQDIANRLAILSDHYTLENGLSKIVYIARYNRTSRPLHLLDSTEAEKCVQFCELYDHGVTSLIQKNKFTSLSRLDVPQFFLYPY